MARLLAQGRRQIIAFFHEVRVRYVEEDEVDQFDPHHLSFINVNTPEDWERVQQILREQERPTLVLVATAADELAQGRGRRDRLLVLLLDGGHDIQKFDGRARRGRSASTRSGSPSYSWAHWAKLSSSLRRMTGSS